MVLQAIQSCLHDIVYEMASTAEPDAAAAGPHGWDPPLEAASKERHGSGGPNYTRME